MNRNYSSEVDQKLFEKESSMNVAWYQLALQPETMSIQADDSLIRLSGDDIIEAIRENRNDLIKQLLHDNALKEFLRGLESHMQSLRKLQSLGITPNKKDFTGQIGEWLVAELYNGIRAKRGNEKGWDVKAGDRYIQVKTHSKAITNTTSRFSSIKPHPFVNIDELVTIIFSHDYKLQEFYLTPWQEVIALCRVCNDGYRINWDEQHMLDINSLPNQPLVSLFR